MFTRNDSRPQPKPRLSLAKTTRVEDDCFIPRGNGSIVQRIKPVFEQSTIASPQEPKPIRQQQQQSISIPYTYQTGKLNKATCLDDIIPSKVRSFLGSTLD